MTLRRTPRYEANRNNRCSGPGDVGHPQLRRTPRYEANRNRAEVLRRDGRQSCDVRLATRRIETLLLFLPVALLSIELRRTPRYEANRNATTDEEANASEKVATYASLRGE